MLLIVDFLMARRVFAMRPGPNQHACEKKKGREQRHRTDLTRYLVHIFRGFSPVGRRKSARRWWRATSARHA